MTYVGTDGTLEGKRWFCQYWEGGAVKMKMGRR